eukprot:gene2539-3501_t
MSIPWVDSEDDLSSLDLDNASSSRYYTKEEASHVFLFCTNHLMFQQAEVLEWQLFRLNSIVKIDENEKHKVTKIISISTNHNLRLYKNALTVHDSLAPQMSVPKPNYTGNFNFQYSSPTRENFVIPSATSLSNSLSTSFENMTSSGKTPGSNYQDTNVASAVLLPTTSVHVLFSKYNVVVSVDVSPSMSVVDPDSGDIPLDRAYMVFQKLMDALSQPIQVPESKIEFFPDIYVTVIAQGSLVKPLITICQDVLVTKDTLKTFLKQVTEGFEYIEEKMSQLKKMPPPKWYKSSFNDYIENAILSYEFMQRDATPILVLITDGIFNALKINDSLRRLKENDISFGIISVISKKQKPISFGHIFNQGFILFNINYSSDYLEFMVKSLDGTLFKWSFFNDADEIREKEQRKTTIKFPKNDKLEDEAMKFESNINLNRKKLIHYALLFKSSPVNVVDREMLSQTLVYTPQKTVSNYDLAKITEYRIKGVEFENLLKMRILEGFFIEGIGFGTDENSPNHIQMKSYFLPNVILKYTMTVVNTKESKIQTERSSIFLINIEVTLHAPKVFIESFLEFKKQYVPGSKNEKDVNSNIMQYVLSISYADHAVVKCRQISSSDLYSISMNMDYLKFMAEISNKKGDYFREESIVCIVHEFPKNTQYQQIGDLLVKDLYVGNKISQKNEYEVILSKMIERVTSTTKVKKNLYLAILPDSEEDLDSLERIDDYDYDGFCLIRIEWISTTLAKIKLWFYNVPSPHRIVFTTNVSDALKDCSFNNSTKINHDAVYTFSANPVISKIIVRLPYSNDTLEAYYKHLYMKKPNYVSFLHHERMLWDLTDVEDVIIPMLSLIFSQRNLEGFTALSYNHTPLFYRIIEMRSIKNELEISFSKETQKKGNEVVVKSFLFYNVHYLAKSQKLIIELFMEPQDGFIRSNGKNIKTRVIFEQIQEYLKSVDTDIISAFLTFNIIKNACLDKNKKILDVEHFASTKIKSNVIPFQIDKIYNRGNTKKIEFKKYSKQNTDKEDLKEENEQLFNRLNYLVSQLNSLEIPLNFLPWDKNKSAKDVLCYAKVYHHDSILLTFLPKMEENSIIMYICECQQSSLSSLDSLSTSSIQDSLFNRKKSMGEDYFDTLEEGTLTYINFIKAYHQYSYSYGVYSLLQGKKTPNLGIFKNSVEACVEYTIEIDLSEFLEIIYTTKGTFFKNRGKTDNSSPYAEAKQNFDGILNRYFKLVPGIDYYFVLNEKLLSRERKENNNEEKEKEKEKKIDEDLMQNFWEMSQASSFESSGGYPDKDIFKELENVTLPSFLRMECAITSNVNPNEPEMKIAVTNIPVEKLINRFQNPDDFDDRLDTSPLSSKSVQSTSWIETITTKPKTVLRLIFISMPPDVYPLGANNFVASKDHLEHLSEKYEPNQFDYCESKFIDTSEVQKVDPTASSYLSLNLLPTGPKNIMTKIKKKIQGLISREIINCLLYTSPSSYSVQTVLDHIPNLSQSLYKTLYIDLTFIDKDVGLRLFQKELKKSETPIIKQIGYYHIVYFNYDENKQYYGFSDKDLKIKVPKEEWKDIFITRPYWIIIQIKNTRAEVLFYWVYKITLEQQSEIENLVKEGIKKVNQIVNKLILLNDLEESRLCSSYLVGPSTNLEKSSKDISFFEKSTDIQNLFSVNEFECENLQTIRFQLHKRLDYETAVRTLCSSLFKPNIVQNRENFFVIREKEGGVYYFRMRKTQASSPKPGAQEFSVSYQEETDLVLNLDIKSQSKVFLDIDFYGVRPPSFEITKQFKNLVENKLSNATLNILAKMLKVNPECQLTPDDLEFLRPFSKKPERAILYQIPNQASNLLLFLLLLQQNLLTYLKKLIVSERDEVIEKYDFSPSSFAFLFQNGLTSITSLQKFNQDNSITKGISCIYLSIVDEKGKIVKKFDNNESDEIPDDSVKWDSLKPEIVDTTEFTDSEHEIEAVHGDYFIQATKPKKRYRLLIEIWTKGSIDLDSLIDRISLSTNQSVFDYYLERIIFKQQISISEAKEQLFVPFQNLSMQARHLNVPSIVEVRKRVFLPIWSMKSFIEDVKDKLSRISLTNIYTNIEVNSQKPYYLTKYEPKVLDEIIGSNNVVVSFIGCEFGKKSGKSVLPRQLDLIYLNQLISKRRYSIAINISNSEFSIIGYNIKSSIIEKLSVDFLKLISLNKCRVFLLNSILHQKMGLFFHSASENLASSDKKTNSQDDLKLTMNNIDILINSSTGASTSSSAVKFNQNSNLYDSKINMNLTNIDFNILLKGVYYKNDDPGITQGIDPLKYHGKDFKNMVTLKKQEIQKQNEISSIYTVLNRLRDSALMYSNSLHVSDFKLILGNSRLFHYCRSPIFFHTYDENSLPLMIAPFKSKNQKEIMLFKKILETFLEEYVKYLETMDVVVLALIDGSKESKISSEEIITSHTTIYLQKIMHGGVLIFELGFDSIFAFLDLYVSDGKSNKKKNLISKEFSNRRLFLQSVTELKNSLHMNSFLHDFHLKYFVDFLQNVQIEFPNFEILNLLNNFHQYYETPPHYSKGTLYKHQFNESNIKELLGDICLKSIFNHICQFNEVFECENLNIRNVSQVIVLNENSILSKEEIENNFKISSIIFLDDNENINFFTVYASMNTIYPELNKLPIKNRIENIEKLATLNEKKLKSILIASIESYKIHSLWNECQNFKISYSNFQLVLETVHKKSLEKFDESLKDLMNSDQFPWKNILNQLKEIYGSEKSGVIQSEEDSKIIHFLITFKQQEMINIQYNIELNIVEIYYLKKDSTNVSKDDCEFISTFINNILQILWRILMSDAKKFY